MIIIAWYENNILTWNVPDYYYDAVLREFSKYKRSKLFDKKIQKKSHSWLSKLLKIPKDEIEWENAVTYQCNKKDIRKPKNNPAVYNKEFDLKSLPANFDKKNHPYQNFINYPYCSAIIKDNKFVSVSFTRNRAIGVYTEPNYRRKGYSKACLELLTYKLLKDDIFDHMGYGTTLERTGASETAESAGYFKTEEGIWITLAPNTYKKLPLKFVSDDIRKANV